MDKNDMGELAILQGFQVHQEKNLVSFANGPQNQ